MKLFGTVDGRAGLQRESTAFLLGGSLYLSYADVNVAQVCCWVRVFQGVSSHVIGQVAVEAEHRSKGEPCLAAAQHGLFMATFMAGPPATALPVQLYNLF
jgi:hypothetical protein